MITHFDKQWIWQIILYNNRLADSFETLAGVWYYLLHDIVRVIIM